MYTVDGNDQVVELTDFPQQSAGAPMPLLLAQDGELVLAYELSDSETEYFAIVAFDGVATHRFGPPNDETLEGHPLYGKGLESYGVYEVQSSSWIRALERMNRVHPAHRSAVFSRYRHFIFTFHDTMLECVARGVRSVVRAAYAERAGLLDKMRRHLRR
jgi:hypothetical protein